MESPESETVVLDRCQPEIGDTGAAQAWKEALAIIAGVAANPGAATFLRLGRSGSDEGSPTVRRDSLRRYPPIDGR